MTGFRDQVLYRRGGQRGFSLIELVVVISIAAILMSMAIPSFRILMANTKIRASSSDLQTALLLARSEAVKRSANVRVSRTSSDWNAGWQVLDAGGNVLGAFSGDEQVDITCASATLTFQASGRLTGAAPSFDVEHVDGIGTARCVSVELSGRPYTKQGACS